MARKGKPPEAAGIAINSDIKPRGRPFPKGQIPPGAKPWPKGVSGNPSGFPASKRAAAKYVEAEARRRLAQLVRSNLNQAIGHTEDATEEEVAATQKELAAGLQKGNPTLAIEYLERAAGPLKLQLEVSEPPPPPAIDLSLLTDDELAAYELAGQEQERLLEEASKRASSEPRDPEPTPAIPKA